MTPIPRSFSDEPLDALLGRVEIEDPNAKHPAEAFDSIEGLLADLGVRPEALPLALAALESEAEIAGFEIAIAFLRVVIDRLPNRERIAMRRAMGFDWDVSLREAAQEIGISHVALFKIVRRIQRAMAIPEVNKPA